MYSKNAQQIRRRREDLSILRILENEARVEIIKTLLEVEGLCLSDIARELEKKGFRMNLPGVVKHVQRLEGVQILRSESGRLSDEPDARKTIYSLRGKERIKKIMNQLIHVRNLLESNITFSETATLALRIQTRGSRVTEEEVERLKSSLARCESEEIIKHLTEDEKTNVELWKMMLALKQ